jgi:hypothetical protein
MKVICVKCEKPKHPVCFTPAQLKTEHPRCRQCIKEYTRVWSERVGYCGAKGMVRL